MDPDPDAAFYRSLQRSYGSERIPALDAEVRVVIVDILAWDAFRFMANCVSFPAYGAPSRPTTP